MTAEIAERKMRAQVGAQEALSAAASLQNTFPVESDTDGSKRQSSGEAGAMVLQEYWNNEEWRAWRIQQLSEEMRIRTQDPQVREQLKESGREKFRRLWEDESWKKKKIEALRNPAAERVWTDEGIEKLRQARLGKSNSEEAKRKQSESKGGIYVLAYPFLQRGLINAETAAILGRKNQEVEGLTKRLRQNGKLATPTKEDRFEIRSRANKWQKMLKRQGNTYTPEQQHGFVFANKLREAGLITEDLTFWEKLNELSKKANIEISTQKLRYEVLLKALEDESEDRQIWQTYVRLGEEVDKEWFRANLFKEASFIDSLLKGKQSESEGEVIVQSNEQNKVKEQPEPTSVLEPDNFGDIFTSESADTSELQNVNLANQDTHTERGTTEHLDDGLTPEEVEQFFRLFSEEERIALGMIARGEDPQEVAAQYGIDTKKLDNLTSRSYIKFLNTLAARRYLYHPESQNGQEEHTDQRSEEQPYTQERIVQDTQPHVVYEASQEAFHDLSYESVGEDPRSVSPKREPLLREPILTADGEFDWDANVAVLDTLIENTLHCMFFSSEDIKDLKQEVWVKVYKGLATWKADGASFSWWVNRIAKNTSIDEIRRRQRRIKQAELSPDVEMVRSEGNFENQVLMKSLVRDLLRKTPSHHRQLLELKYIHDLSLDEISAITGMSQSNIKSKLYRARQYVVNLVKEQKAA